MKTQFDSIMRLSNKGYIDNPEDVEEITDAMMNCTLAEMTVPSYNTACLGGRIMECFYLPADAAVDVRFGELLNLIRVCCLEIDNPEMAAKLVPMLRSVSQSVGSVSLFTAIPIKSLTQFITDKTQSPLPGYLYRRICEKSSVALGYPIRDNTTVGDFIGHIENRMTRWLPGSSLKKFTEYAHSCCEIVKMLLVDCLRVGYIEMFKLSEFHSRIEKLAAEQGCCSKSDLMWLNKKYAESYNTKYDYTTDDKIFDDDESDEFRDDTDFDEDDFDMEDFDD